MNEFGKRLKELRTAKDMSLNDLANAVHLSKSRLGNYEQGTREADFETLETLADYFNVSTDYLIGKDDVTPIILGKADIESYELLSTYPILKDMLLAGGKIYKKDPKYIEALVYTMKQAAEK